MKIKSTKLIFGLCAGFLLSFAMIADAKAYAQLDKPAPNFTLKDQNGQNHSLSDFKGKYVVLEWFNDQCPFVKKHYGSNNMQNLQEEYTKKGVIWLTINSSAPGKQGHLNSDAAKEIIQKRKANMTALLLDGDGRVGNLYGAKTTPHMYVINPEGVLIYRGAIDNQPTADPADIPSSTNYVRSILDAALSGQKVKSMSTKPYGCSVKY